jgi:hypothetical protein
LVVLEQIHDAPNMFQMVVNLESLHRIFARGLVVVLEIEMEIEIVYL